MILKVNNIQLLKLVKYIMTMVYICEYILLKTQY